MNEVIMQISKHIGVVAIQPYTAVNTLDEKKIKCINQCDVKLVR